MEFLDPKKQKAHKIRLIVGYVVIGVALLTATIILIYRAYGFGVKNGQVVQNGLVFVSSSPGNADIKISGQDDLKYKTNTHFLIESGKYTFTLSRNGYNSWRRAISVDGGKVVRFDYPMLFPSKLTTSTVRRYDTLGGLATQSPDHRWILSASSTSPAVFDILDLSNPKESASFESISLPPETLKLADGVQSWQLGEWASDSRHVLLKHVVQKNGQQSVEYIMLDTQDPTRSLNVSQLLNTAGEISLRDGAYDQYYVYDKTTASLLTASIKKPALQLLLVGVAQFASQGNDTVVYATTVDAPAGKALVMLYQGGTNYKIRQVTAASSYILDAAQYKGAWYVAAGSPADNRTYIYQNPVSILKDKPNGPLVPEQVFKVASPNYVSFSSDGRFVTVENGPMFGVYDAENEKGYQYNLSVPMDPGQEHASWMDGARLGVISGGKAYVFDYDYANQATLVPVLQGTLPFYSKDYKYVYALTQQAAKAADGKDIIQNILTSTPLRTPQDL